MWTKSVTQFKLSCHQSKQQIQTFIEYFERLRFDVVQEAIRLSKFALVVSTAQGVLAVFFPLFVICPCAAGSRAFPFLITVLFFIPMLLYTRARFMQLEMHMNEF